MTESDGYTTVHAIAEDAEQDRRRMDWLERCVFFVGARKRVLLDIELTYGNVHWQTSKPLRSAIDQAMRMEAEADT